MPKLPQVSGKQTIKVLQKFGFSVASQRGSHIKVIHKGGRVAIIPKRKIIKKGTLKKGILNPLSISVKDFINALKK